jgi:signal transduction histidine kinase
MPPPVLAQLRTMRGLIDSTVGSVRRIAADLRPVMLDDLGLLPAIDWLLTDFTTRYGIDIELICTAATCDVSIRDNGTGIERRPSRHETRPSPSGLAGVRDRVRRLGGSVAIGSEAGGGFALRLSVPRDAVEMSDAH